MKQKTLVISLTLTVLISFFYWPTFRWFYESWTSGGFLNQDNPYGHGLLVPLISGFIVWTRRDHLGIRKPSAIGVLVLALGALVYLMGFTLDIRSLVALSLPIVLTGLSLLLLGIQPTKALAFPLFFLIFMIPPPFIQDLTYHLQQISRDSSAWIANRVGIETTIVDSSILLGDPLNPTATLEIAPACSGINTLIALLALAALYAFVLNGALYKRVLLFALAFPMAILANSLRIATVIMRADNRGIDSALTLHDWSDPMFFAIAFLILVLIGIILGLTMGTRGNAEKRTRHVLLSIWLGIMVVAYALAALFGMAGSSIGGQGLEDAPAWALWFLSVVAVSGMICVTAVYLWKRWGFYGLCASSIGILAVSLVFGASIIEALSGVIGVAILYGMLRLGKEKKAWAQLR